MAHSFTAWRQSDQLKRLRAFVCVKEREGEEYELSAEKSPGTLRYLRSKVPYTALDLGLRLELQYVGSKRGKLVAGPRR